MSELSFAEILKMQLLEIKPPQALPVGTYLCIVEGLPEITQLGPNNTDCVVFGLRVIQAQDDVTRSSWRK